MRGALPKLLEFAGCFAVLAALPAVALLPVWMGWRFPMDVDAAMMQAPWESARPFGEHIAMDAFAREQVYRYYPWYKHISETAREDGTAYWYPYEAAGVPFAAAWRTRAFSPFTLPFYWLALETALALSLYLKMLVAGICAYYAARRFGLLPAPALFAGSVYALSGVIWVWGLFPIGDIAPWLPLLVLQLERLSFGHGWTWPGGAVSLGLMLLGGEPFIVTAYFVWGGAFLGLRILTRNDAPHIAQSLIGWTLMSAGGAALAALQWIPFVEFNTHATLDEGFSHTWPHLLSLLGLGFPQLTGFASWATLLSAGIVPLALLGLWLAVRPFLLPLQRVRLECLLLSAVAGLLVSVLFLNLLAALAMASVVVLAVACMAAVASEEWTELDLEGMNEAYPRARRLAAPVLALALLSGGVALAIEDDWRLWHALPLGLVFLLAAAAVLWHSISRPSVRITVYSLCLLGAASQLSAQWNLPPHTDAARVFPGTEAISAFKAREIRVTGEDRIADWPLAGNGIEQIYAPGGIRLRRYSQLMQRIEETPALLGRTGVTSILAGKQMLRGALSTARPSLEIEELLPIGLGYFKLPEGTPHARVAFFGETARTAMPEKLVPGGPVLLEGGALPEEDPMVEESATIKTLQRAAQKIVLEVKSPRAGVLVLCDSWYPGWSATVNGIERPVFPVDVNFRGVEVDEGPNHVEFYYNPRVFVIGQIISGAAVAALLLGFAYWWLYWRRMRAIHPWEMEMH